MERYEYLVSIVYKVTRQTHYLILFIILSILIVDLHEKIFITYSFTAKLPAV